MKKKIKDGSLYFRQKDILRPLGAVLMPIGLVWYYFGWSYLSYILPSIMVPAGLVMFIIGGAKHISDNDIAEQVEHAMLDYDKSVTDRAGFDRVVLKQPAPLEMCAYSFGADAGYFKKGKNGTLISDRYTRTHIFYTKDSLLVVGRTVSIADLDESKGIGREDFDIQIPFSSIRQAALEPHETTVSLTNTGKATVAKWCELVLTGEEGELLRIPVQNDMDAASLVEDIQHRIAG